jgi:hypothetical protein
VINHRELDAFLRVPRALKQCVDDFGETGQCVCLQAKEEAIASLTALRDTGIELNT